MKLSSTIAALVTLSILLGSTLLFAQTASPGAGGQQAPLVKLNLIVTDRDNHSLDDITKEEIKVYEDKVEQTLLLFEKDERLIDYAIVLDTSGSFRRVMNSAVGAVTEIITSNRDSDRTFIERFISSDKIETLQDFTGDRGLLLGGLNKINIEEGQSAVLDGLYLAVDYTGKHSQKDRRQAILLITDGEDRSSFYKLDDVVKLLHETKTPVFIIGVVLLLDKDAGLIRRSPRDTAEHLLATIADESGGRLFLPKNVGELKNSVNEIVHVCTVKLCLPISPAI